MKFNLPTQPVQFTYDPKGVQSIVRMNHRLKSDESACLALAALDLQASTIAIWMDGQYTTVQKVPFTFPLRIEWKLWLGVGCQVDDDPFTGVTILKDETDFNEREGLLFQVDCRAARSMWLTARVIDNYPGLAIQVPLRTIFWPLSGRPELIVGTAIG